MTVVKTISMLDVSNEINHVTSSFNDDEMIIVNGKVDRDTLSITITISDEIDEKTILILAAHDTEKGTFAVFITNGDDGGHKILYRNISKNPMIGLKKYLPNIIRSTKNMITNKKADIA